MKLLLAINAPTWTAGAPRPLDQFRRNAFAKVLRDVADRLQNSGSDGNDVKFDREEMTATFRLDQTPAANAA